MKKIFLLITITFSLFFASCSTDSVEEIDELYTSVQEPEMENDMLSLLNNYRSSLGLDTLTRTSAINTHAETHNDYMILKNQISHDNFSARAEAIENDPEILAQRVSENVASGFFGSQNTFNFWLSSTLHKNAIEGDFSHCGISVKKSSQGNYFYIIVFVKK